MKILIAAGATLWAARRLWQRAWDFGQKRGWDEGWADGWNAALYAYQRVLERDFASGKLRVAPEPEEPEMGDFGPIPAPGRSSSARVN